MIGDHTRDDSMPAIARRVLAAAPPRFALAGLSMGGYVAFEIMRQAPHRVAKLALLDTGCGAETPEHRELRKIVIDHALNGGSLADTLEIHFPLLVHPSRATDDALKRVVHAMAEETGLQAFLRQLSAQASRPESRPQLAGIRVPVVVVSGEDDTVCRPQLQRELVELCPGAELASIPGCGHMAPLEQPAAVVEVLRRWLRPPGQ